MCYRSFTNMMSSTCTCRGGENLRPRFVDIYSCMGCIDAFVSLFITANVCMHCVHWDVINFTINFILVLYLSW